LMVTSRGDHLFLVVNAACKEQDFAHMRQRLGGGAELEVIEDRALLALQGPKAADVLARLAPPCRHMLFMTGETLTIADEPCFVTRSGYTGEDGYEISVAADKAEHLARLLLAEAEVAAIGLGARDSLRLEAGLCLYGNDIDATTTPIEASLAWTVSRRRRAEGGFPGADVVLRQIAEGVGRKRVGLLPEGKVPARPHAQVTDAAGTAVGEVTSGGFGPTVGAPVAMGYVAVDHAQVGTPVQFVVRGKALPGRVAKLPFVEHRYFKK
ncbi:MAG: glycine cleavage T C-terminal barrel domain-containing protein, partial [Alphaproteobacteria bacterium]|nr:glycine cleavage T C-terminal barrel domain-containing protein [Alphaproteobacteria bacterium]